MTIGEVCAYVTCPECGGNGVLEYECTGGCGHWVEGECDECDGTGGTLCPTAGESPESN